MMATSKSAIVDLWVPADSPAKINYDYVDATFPVQKNDIGVIFTAVDGNTNVVTKDYFDIMWEVDSLIKSLSIEHNSATYTYTDLCYKDTANNCEVTGATAFWSADKTTYDTAMTNHGNDPLPSLAITTYPLTNNPVVYNPDGFGGAMTYDGSNFLLTAESMKVTWWLTNPDACVDDYDCAELTFMTKFQDEMEKFVESKKATVAMNYITTRSLDDALAEAIGADIPLVGAAYLVMIIVCCCSLGRGVMDGCGRSSIALAGGGVMTVFLSTLAGFGISAACGAWFTSLHSLLPFILLGIGVDDMFVIVNAFMMTRESLDLEDRVAIACRNAGVPILYTSLTDFVAFLLGSTSSLKGISSFCVYAAVAVLFDFFLQVTMFVSIMVMDERRRQANLSDCLCCIPLSKEGVEKREKHRFSTVQTEEFYNKPKEQGVGKVSTVYEFFELYATKVSKFAIPILVCFAGMFAVGIWGSSEATEGFDANKLVLDSSHFRSYNTMNKDYKMSTFESMAPVFIYVKDIPYHEAAYQVKVLDLTETATNLEYSSGPSTVWLKDFLTYLATQGDICSGSCDYSSTGVDVDESVFNTKLAAFLAESDYMKYSSDLSLNSNGGISASRTMLWHDKIDGVKQQVNAMEEIVKLCDSYTGFGAKVPFADSWIYVYVYQFVIFFSELMTNFGLVLVAVLIVSPIVLKQPIATLLLIVTVAMIDTELFGMIHIYGDNVNSFTGLGLIMAVGLVVDYNAHIIHAFFSNDPELDRQDRLRLTMKQMGKSVALGGLTSLIGLLPLAGSQCEVFRVFFKMTLAIIILGMLHGLIFMPALLVTLPIPTPPALIVSHKKYRGEEVGGVEVPKSPTSYRQGTFREEDDKDNNQL